MAEIEDVFTAQLSHWNRLPMMAFFARIYVRGTVAHNNSGERVTGICPINLIGIHERHAGGFAIRMQTGPYFFIP